MKELFGYILGLNFKELFVKPTDNIYIQFFRYVFVGGFAFVIDAGSLFVIEKCGVHYLAATALAFIVGLMTNYILSKIIVFTKETTNSNTGLEFVTYGVIGVAGLFITEGLMYLFTAVLDIYFMISKMVAAVIVLIWNFAARKIILYRE